MAVSELYNSHEVPRQECPTCGYGVDRATRLHDAEVEAPEAGDVTICMRCATILQFVERVGGLGLDHADEDVRAKVERDPLVQRARRLVAENAFTKGEREAGRGDASGR